jgi:predicted AlkP superfamily pyrophosphatase or phosphodiesterase
MPQLNRSRRWLFAALPVAAMTMTGARPAAPAPKLVVLITVDQMRADYLDRFASQYKYGLARLIKNGAVYTNAFHDHANAETAPGHATVGSGREPYSTGIVLNAIGVPDSKSPLIGGGGPGASPFRFVGTTLFDWIKAKDSRSRALSVSRKDRGAILPIGKSKENVSWYA